MRNQIEILKLEHAIPSAQDTNTFANDSQKNWFKFEPNSPDRL